MKMTRSKEINMTEGPIFRSVILYALPIVLSNILQIFFNAADLAVVGNFSDAKTVATAAVGATSSIVSLVVNTVMGLSVGISVTLARALGAKERDVSSRIIHTSLAISVLIGVVIGVVGYFLSPFAMSVTKCPPEAKTMAIHYLQIYFLGAPGILIYNFGSAILRTAGETKRPLQYLAIAGASNVLLNLLFVIVFSMDAEGVALATTLTQYLGAFLTLRCLMRREDELRVSLRSVRVHRRELVGILRYGLPSAFTNAMYCFANVQIQSAINTFGESAVAGSAAAGSLEGFVTASVTAMNAATTAFVGQNIGAGNKKRVGRSISICFWVTVTCSFVLGAGIFLIGDPLYSIYVGKDTVALAAAARRGLFMLLPYFLSGALNIFGVVSQTFGYAMAVTVNSVVGVFGFRTLWMQFIFPRYPTLDTVFLCFPVTWILILIANSIVFSVAYSRYRRFGTVR
ncbi:MAG: MATE family efflux transporter [Ruminococcaceae bacterium]|nr:MATE family efflux transporter [Oscillospiraceae bacterium]